MQAVSSKNAESTPRPFGGIRSKPKRFAVIGAGMAGIACARTLVQAGHDVTVFEQHAEPAGRTAIVDSVCGSFDAGAQYFTVRDPRFQKALDTVPGLCRAWSANTVRVLDEAGRVVAAAPPPGERHWVAIPAMDALVKTWAEPLSKNGQLLTNTPIASVERDVVSPHQWQLRSETPDGGTKVHAGFDTVLLAVPAPVAPAPPPDLAQMASVPAPVAALPAFAAVPAGLPSDLLLRRPDIRAAEQQLIGANANIGAARASFFPRISLTASLGRVSTDLDGLLGSGGTGAWSFAPSITLPIFDGGRNQANLDVAKAGRAIAVAQYEKAIQSAFREVADALAGRGTLMAQLDALQAQATAERERYRLTDLRYRNGVASHLDLLDAQRSLFAIEQALAQGQLAERSNEVLLYKALGGGWTETQTSASAR